ncbi:transcription termination/antitermination NusG family protein [Tardiphaga sp.]|jgi:hypothetical protein|uniref:transcription termination/antitermination NusG family protein n=1 Tax=Tardiphaga sp. TaxID=1926292 RepID=UPI0037D9A910
MGWYIAIISANWQRRAESELASLGYETFWPKTRRWVSHARTKTAKEYPILGRYLFVSITDRNFWAVTSVRGIDCLLTDEDGAPAEIAYEEVWRLKQRYLAGEWDYVRTDCRRPVFGMNERNEQIIVGWEDNKPMPIGARVAIMTGEFEDMLATITGRKGKRLDFKVLDANTYGRINETFVRAA